MTHKFIELKVMQYPHKTTTTVRSPAAIRQGIMWTCGRCTSSSDVTMVMIRGGQSND